MNRKSLTRSLGLAAAISTISPLGILRADEISHAQDDAFAAEVAAMLPPVLMTAPSPPAANDRITLGNWSAIIPWTPHIPVSAANLPDGRILTFASNQRTTFPSGPEFTYAATWNPATGQFVEINHPSHDMFCGALVMLPDGRVLVNGGRNTTVRSSIFDWRVNTWTRTPDMNDPRWYNTSVALPNGRVWTVSGSGGSGTAERWDQSSGYTRLPGINWNTVLAEPGYINIWHPFLLLAPDGRLIHFGPTDTMHWVGTDGTGSLSNTGNVVPGSHYPKEGAWAMYDEGRILVAGGGANTTANSSDTTTGTSTTTAYTVDLRSGSPVVTPAASMQFARQFANSVVLPNGEVMVMGGNTSGLKFNDTGSILTPEIWNPATGQWRRAADMSVPRNYHSLALLLPDGRVLSGGSGLGGNSADHRDAQLFTPPTLFNADGSLATRPVINTAPQAIGVATRFFITATPGLQKFSFIKMSAITHSVNTDLRYLSLPFTETSPGNYEVSSHVSLNVMTPGYWMLFGLNAAGTHSVAKVILVDAINAVSLAAPGNQASYVNQPASLQMVASAPAGAVLAWSATGLPSGMSIHSANGLISGTPSVEGTFSVRVTVSGANTSDFKDFTWSVQPVTFNASFSNFSGASGLTVNGNAAISGSVLRVTPAVNTQAGSAYLTQASTIGPDTSLSTRFVFRIHGAVADGADGMTFVIQGVGPNALGITGSGLGYDGIGQSVAVEIDNYAGTGDANANHIAVLSNGSVAAHLATATPGWDLEDGTSQSLWVDYEGPTDQLRIYLARGASASKPATPTLTTSVNLPSIVGSQAWFGFTAGTGGLNNNHDVESWSLSLNAFALPGTPSIVPPVDQISVVGAGVNYQMEASDPNNDLLTWSATGLPAGASINPSSGLISGAPSQPGVYSPTISVTDGNTSPASASFQWTVNPQLTLAPIAGAAVLAGSTVPVSAQANGGLNPEFSWNFGDGSPATPFSASPAATHLFASPGRFLVTVTARDVTGRQVTSSYRQGVHLPPTASRPTSSSSIAFENRAGGPRLWVVNPDNDSVTVFHADTRAKLAEISVGRAPRTLAIAADGRVWVANTESANISIVAPDFTVGQIVSLPRGSRPFGIVFDPAGENAFVALEAGGKILKLDPITGATVGTLDVGLNVRHLSVTSEGSEILATRFVTPLLPGEDTANPQTSNGVEQYGGEVLRIASADLTLIGKVVLQHSDEPDTSNSSRGIPNYLGAAVISPDGGTAWVPSKQDNIKRGLLRNNESLTHDMAVRSIASRINLSTRTEDLDGRVDFDNAGIASAAAFDNAGLYLFAALEGSREVAVVDSWAKQEILRFDAGRAPQGLALSPDGRTLYVHNFMDRTVTVHDLSSLAAGSEATPPAPVILNCVQTEKLTPTVLLGKQLFYDTRDERIAFQQYVSCAGCHNDGGQDGRVWDFTQFGEGLRNTITLRGHGGTAQGPLHWTGNFDEVQDFEGQIRGFAGGQGLMSDSDFHASTRSQPMGDPKAGLSSDLDALAAYVTSLSTNGESPDRNPDGSFTAAALAGKAVFQAQNCAQCHSGAQFTDSALNVFHDVGTIKPSTGSRLGAPLTGLDTPTLLGLWSTAPYLHDGSAATIEDAITVHSGVNISGEELTNLSAFLRQLDDLGTAPPPAQITWNNPAAIVFGTALSTAQLNATANVPGTFEYTPALGTVLNVGNNQSLSVTFTPADPNAYGPASKSVSISVSRAPLSITADNKSKVYGAALPALTATYSGFVNGDTIASLDSSAVLSTTATASSPVGNYAINVSGASDSNYAITFVPGVLSVTRAPLTVTADNKSKTYGAANPSFTAAYSGFVNGDSVGSLDSPVSLSTPATSSSPVGTYAITPVGGSDANYTITRVNGVLTVNRAALAIRADDKTKTIGSANPTLTATYTGFVNGDTAASLDNPVILSTTATTSSPEGTYPITASGAADANYAITHLNGVLTVTRPTIRINFQPSNSSVPAGYLVDSGSTFGNRGNGQSYGWSSSNTSYTRDRNSSRSPDQRYDTLNHMQQGGSRSWSIAVPNGSYQVWLVAGDPSHIDSAYRISVEGVLTVSGNPTSASRWVQGTRTVTVSDGQLTVSNATGAKNNKVCFIEITPVTTVTAQAINLLEDELIEVFGDNLRLEMVGDGSGFLLQVRGGPLGPVLPDARIESSRDMKTWLPLAGALFYGDGTARLESATEQQFFRAVK